jgi:magnesium chelatase family protein
MATTTWTGALHGVDAIPIEVEVDLMARLPGICIVGLPDNAIRESGERIRSAIQSAGFDFPRKRVVVNLAPADQKKDGTSLDLPIAIAILAASGQVQAAPLRRYVLAGELSLSGELRPIRGGLAFAELARDTNRALVLPRQSAEFAGLARQAEVYGFDKLAEVIEFVNGSTKSPTTSTYTPQPSQAHGDFADICGQEIAKRALEIAATGGHHVLMLGPPGCGKTMLARSFPSLLPDLSYEEAIEVTRIHNIAGVTPWNGHICQSRPFRSPHHTITLAGMVGDRRLRPGEICLAHQGVLFLDEATEFERRTIETLRQPLESHELHLTRAIGSARYPAKFNLILAANPCPCGNYGSNLPCRCPMHSVQRYRSKLSGPILDRIDLHVHLERTAPEQLFASETRTSSARIRERVVNARAFAKIRVTQHKAGESSMTPGDKQAEITEACKTFLIDSAKMLDLSTRSLTRTLRVARTIADLDGAHSVGKHHIAEALAFRVQVNR